MRDLIKEAAARNGAAVAVNGRGVRRRKLTADERIQLAVDLVLGRVRAAPLSLKQAAEFVGSPRHRVGAAIKRADCEAAARAALIDEAEEVNRRIDVAATTVDNIVADVESSTRPRRITKRAFKLHERVQTGLAMARFAIEFCPAPFDEAMTGPNGHPLFGELDRRIIRILRDEIAAERARDAALEAAISVEEDDGFLTEVVVD
jgi:hypothetical protein